jgi:hypothetical protein
LALAGKTAYEMTSDRRDSLNRYVGFTIQRFSVAQPFGIRISSFPRLFALAGITDPGYNVRRVRVL